MIYDPVTIKQGSTVRDALALMAEYKIGGIPVVDDNRYLVGIVTNRDLRFERNMDKRHFLARRKMQRLNMRDVDERVVHLAALQFQLDDGRVQLRAGRQTDALRQRPRHAVAHLHGYRQNLTSLDKALPRVQPSQVVRRDAVFFQHFEELFADCVVDFALAQNPPALGYLRKRRRRG